MNSPVLERRIHRMEHDKPGKPLRVVREAHVLAGQAEPQPPAPTEEQEDEMPKGQYDRSKAKPRKTREAKPEGEGGQGAASSPAVDERRSRKRKGAGPKKRAGKKARAARAPQSHSKARFGVFSDGSVQVDAPECKGVLSGEDVATLIQFATRLRAK
jgi:hypothetical protein